MDAAPRLIIDRDFSAVFSFNDKDIYALGGHSTTVSVTINY